MDEQTQRLYRRFRGDGIPARFALDRARSTTDARNWDAAQDWEWVEHADTYGWRALIARDGYVVSVEFWDDPDGGMVPDGIEDEPELVTYYAERAEWAGYVVEAFDTSGRIIAEDSCWGRETNYPDSLLDSRETMSEWVAVERWIVNGKPAATIMEGIFQEAEHELHERAAVSRPNRASPGAKPGMRPTRRWRHDRHR